MAFLTSKRTGRAVVLTLAIVAGFAAGGAPTWGAGTEPLRIAVIAEAQSVAGSSIPGGAQLAADEINAHGGVDGRKIEITTYDNHSSAADSVRAFQRAVSEDHANAVIASYVSEVVLALEPWASRLKKDAHAKTVADERDLWPGKMFTTTVVVARTKFAEDHPEAIQALLRAHLETIEWLNAHPDDAQVIVNAELKRLTGKALSDGVMKEAWSRVRFTDDPNRPNILALAEAAEKAGYLKGKLDLAGAFDPTSLAAAKQQRRLEAR